MRSTLLFVLLFTLSGLVVAQDAVYSQFYASPLLLNPAFAGTSRAPQVALHHRSQNVGFLGAAPYRTYSVTYGQYVPAIRSGLGLSVRADQAGEGILSSYDVSAYYAYEIRFAQEHGIRLGLNAGVQHRSLDWDQLIFFDQLDNVTGEVDGSGNPNPTNEQRPESLTRTFADFGAGMLYAGPVFYVGASAFHLTTPDDRILSREAGGFYQGLPVLFSAHMGAQFALGDDISGRQFFLTPNLLYAHQGPFDQLNLGAYAGLGSFFVGGWFRHSFGNSDALIATAGVEWDMYKIGYSYDLTVSGLRTAQAGSHELSLVLNFEEASWVRNRRRAQRYNDCLQLFR